MAHAEQGHPMPGNYHFDASERAWLDFLNEHGYVVLQGVVDADTVARARTSFWDAIETKNPGVDRADTETWELWQLDPRGIVCDGDLMHCQGAWTIRSHPSVRSAFASIWNDPSLIVSFDSPIMWRPWWLPQKEHRRPFCEGLHVDQNPFHKPDRCCVQGMVPLYDVSETTGGLAVVHQSHTDEARNLLKKKPSANEWGALRRLLPAEARRSLSGAGTVAACVRWRSHPVGLSNHPLWPCRDRTWVTGDEARRGDKPCMATLCSMLIVHLDMGVCHMREVAHCPLHVVAPCHAELCTLPMCCMRV